MEKKWVERTLEIYKCVALTVIALLLIGVFIKTPTLFTLKDLQAKKIGIKNMPLMLVRVQGGQLDVEVTNTPLDVEGSVSIER